jgi:hypothetical protein
VKAAVAQPGSHRRLFLLGLLAIAPDALAMRLRGYRIGPRVVVRESELSAEQKRLAPQYRDIRIH